MEIPESELESSELELDPDESTVGKSITSRNRNSYMLRHFLVLVLQKKILRNLNLNLKYLNRTTQSSSQTQN
jgi:hypothetical protein